MTNGIRKDVPQQFLKFIVIESISVKDAWFRLRKIFFSKFVQIIVTKPTLSSN